MHQGKTDRLHAFIHKLNALRCILEPGLFRSELGAANLTITSPHLVYANPELVRSKWRRAMVKAGGLADGPLKFERKACIAFEKALDWKIPQSVFPSTERWLAWRIGKEMV